MEKPPAVIEVSEMVLPRETDSGDDDICIAERPKEKHWLNT